MANADDQLMFIKVWAFACCNGFSRIGHGRDVCNTFLTSICQQHSPLHVQSLQNATTKTQSDTKKVFAYVQASDLAWRCEQDGWDKGGVLQIDTRLLSCGLCPEMAAGQPSGCRA